MADVKMVYIKDKAIPLSKITEELTKMIEKLILGEEQDILKKHQFSVEFTAKHNDQGVFMSGLVINSGKDRVEPDIIEEAGKPIQGSKDGADTFVKELEKLP